MKKHRGQLSSEEFEYVEKVIQRMRRIPPSRYDITEHCRHEMQNDRFEPITEQELYICFTYGDFFEVNRCDDSFRIALRYGTSEEYDTIIVVDVVRLAIVTAYKNHRTDLHHTIDWSRYNWMDSVVNYVGKME